MHSVNSAVTLRKSPVVHAAIRSRDRVDWQSQICGYVPLCGRIHNTGGHVWTASPQTLEEFVTEWWLGARLAQIRERRGMPQEVVAGKLGLTPNYISKLERGDKDGLKAVTLCEWVDALDMEIKIVAKTGEGRAEDDVREQENRLLLPLRRLLLPAVVHVAAPIDEQELTPAKLRVKAAESVADYKKARYEKLANDLPVLVTSIEAAIGLHEGESETKEHLCRLLARAYTLTAETLILLRDETLAHEAVRRAMNAAENTGDPVLRALVAKNHAWAFTQQGMFPEGEAAALRTADEIGEPSIKTAAPGHIAVWGELHRLASRAAAHDNCPDTAKDLIKVAYSAAVWIDGEVVDLGKYWAMFNPAMVSISKVEQALIVGDAGLALRIGEGVQRTDNLLLNWWTHHLRSKAEAQAATRDRRAAIETLKSIRRLAPVWIRNDRKAHDLVLRLLDAVSVRRARSSGLAELAQFMGVPI